MLPRPRQLCRRLIAALLAFMLAAPLLSRADTSEEYEQKASLIWNFIRNSQWNLKRPASPNVPFVIGIYGSDSLSESLREITQNKLTKEGRPVQITHITALAQARGCNILFVSRSESGRFGEILNQVRREGVLTVGESPNFLKAGGVINFVNTPQGVVFELSDENARRERLAFNGQMLNQAVRPTNGKNPSALARTENIPKPPKPDIERD